MKPRIHTNETRIPASIRDHSCAFVAPLPFVAPGVSADYWQRENYQRRHHVPVPSEFKLSRLVLGIMGRLEGKLKRGQTPDNVEPIVAAWAGPLAKWVKVETAKRTAGSKSTTLILNVASSVVAFELRRRIPALQSQLAATGIKEVRLR